MATGWKTCPQCGKNNAESKRFCVECGTSLAGVEIAAPQAPASQGPPIVRELQEAWEAARLRKDLRASGAWNILIGILAIAVGFTYVQQSDCNSVLLVIGLLFIGTGIAVRRAPSPTTSIANAIAMLLLACWNVALFVLAIVASRTRVQTVGGPAFFVPIIFAVLYFRLHARFVRTQHVSKALIADVDAQVKGIQHAKASASDDLIAFRAKRKRWKAKLAAKVVTLVAGNAKKVRFVHSNEFILTAQGEIKPGKRGQVSIRVGADTWKGRVAHDSLQRYENWKATLTIPPSKGSQQAMGVTPAHQDVIRLLQEITDHVSSTPRDTGQEGRIVQLVSLGQEVVPAIIGTIWSVLRYEDSQPRFENAGLLCQAIGRIGGSKAFDALARFAAQESNSAEYRHLRLGAIRGLAHLGDRRAVEPLTAALKDADEDVRQAAAEALAKIGDERIGKDLVGAPGQTRTQKKEM